MSTSYADAHLAELLHPFWNTEIVYNEAVTLVEENGVIAAPLFYTPKKILSVQNAPLTETYEEGRDWVWQDGKLARGENSRLFYFPAAQLYPPQTVDGRTFAKAGGGNLLFSEGHYFHDRQLAVTYTCEKTPWPGVAPAFAGLLLPRTMRLLREKALRLVLFGDSISVGANASGFTGGEPFLPPFGDLLCKALKQHYGAEIAFFNPSVGGKNSVWGLAETKTRVCEHAPDLVILGFGMNDSDAGEALAGRLQQMMEIIRADKAETEFILIATSLPNPLAAAFVKQQAAYKAALEPLCGPGVALCDITGLQNTLMTRKRYIDLTGNHINHPNDFFVRLHAQALCTLLIP